MAFGPRFSLDGKAAVLPPRISRGAPGVVGRAPGRRGALAEPVAVSFDRVTGVAYPSPCSERLVVTADVGGNERTQLHLLERPGVTPRPLTTNLDVIHQFGGWHPNGRTIAFSSNERDSRFFDAYLLDIETGERRCIYQGDGTYCSSSISADGKRLLLQEAGSAWEHTLVVVDLETGAARRLTPEAPAARYKQACWAPDGRTVYCVSDVGRDFLGLAALSAESGALHRVASPEWDIDDFALSPDGTKVVYQVNVDGYSEDPGCSISATAAETVIPIPQGQAYEPYKWFPTFSWSPDSAQVAFTFAAANRPANIYIAPAEGGAAPKRVTDTWNADLDFDELATSELVHYRTFDGRMIPAFSSPPLQAARPPQRRLVARPVLHARRARVGSSARCTTG